MSHAVSDVYDEAIALMRRIPKDQWEEIWSSYDCPLFFNLNMRVNRLSNNEHCCCPTIVKSGLNAATAAIDPAIQKFVDELDIQPANRKDESCFTSDIHDNELERFAEAQRFADTIYPDRYAIVTREWECMRNNLEQMTVGELSDGDDQD